MKKPEAITEEYVYEVFEALETVLDDAKELRDTVDLLKEESVDTKGSSYVEDRRALKQMHDEEKQFLSTRWNYALKSSIGRTATYDGVLAAADSYASTLKLSGKEVSPGRLEMMAAALASTIFGTADRYVQIGGIDSSSYGTPLTRRIEQSLDGHEESPVVTVRIEPAAASTTAKIVKSTPHATKAGKSWVDITNPRVVQVQGGPDERVVAQHPITDVAQEDKDTLVTFRVAGPRSRVLSEEEVAKVDETAIEYGKDGLPRYRSNGLTRTVRIVPGDDRYRISDDGLLEVFIPAGRTSIEERGGNFLQEAVDIAVKMHDGGAASVAVEAAAGSRRNVIEKFEPINTGNPSDPQVNPRPISTAKRN